MPTSHFSQLNEITELIVESDPARVLDIGVGFGKFGVIAREYLELWDGREQYRDWKRVIDGIEAFPAYITPLHEYVYDEIHLGNALDVLPTLTKRYDLILLIDVLEHFSYDEGLELLEKCASAGKNTLISTLVVVEEQEDAFGNPFETHRFQWKQSHLKRFAPGFFVPNRHSMIYYFGSDAPRLKKKIKSLSRQVKYLLPWLRNPYHRIKGTRI